MADKNSKSLAKVHPTAALVDWSNKEMQVMIRETYGKGLNEGEWNLFMGLGKATGLNPFLREIWAVKYGSNPASVFVGRDGYRRSAQAHPEYESHYAMAVYANDEFDIDNGDVRHTFNLKDRGQLIGAYCVVKRKSAAKGVINFVPLSEYKQTFGVWATKPATMIIKVAEAQGLRASFQELFAGTYEESENWKEEAIETPTVTPTAPAPNQTRLAEDGGLETLQGEKLNQGGITTKTLQEIKAALARYCIVSEIAAEDVPAFGTGVIKEFYKKDTLAQLTDGEGKAFASYLENEAFKMEEAKKKAPPVEAKTVEPKRRGRPAKVVPPVAEQEAPEAPTPTPTPAPAPKLPEDEIPAGKIRTDQTKKLFAVWGEYKKMAKLAEDQSATARKRLMKDMFNVDSSVQLNELQADELIARIESMTEMARDANTIAEDAAQAAGESF